MDQSSHPSAVATTSLSSSTVTRRELRRNRMRIVASDEVVRSGGSSRRRHHTVAPARTAAAAALLILGALLMSSSVGTTMNYGFTAVEALSSSSSSSKIKIRPVTMRATTSSPIPTIGPVEYRDYDVDSSYRSSIARRDRKPPSSSSSWNGRSNYWEEDDEHLDYEDDDDDDDDDDDGMGDVVSDFLELRESTGYEILQSDLQQQIDRNDRDPNAFLQEHAGVDASDMEKIAMSSVTEQLPRAALEAFSTSSTSSDDSGASRRRHRRKVSPSNGGKKKVKKSSRSSDETTTASGSGNSRRRPRSYRVTPEEEIRLAKLIQKGVALHKVRTDAEERLGREVTKQEWAELAGLPSAKDLRRLAASYRKAKHDLVTANMGLVHAVVNQVWSSRYKMSGIGREELVQEGSLGLLRAAELFDPARGLRFSTYAVVWIKGTLSNTHAPELVRLPAREKTKWNKIVQAQKDLTKLQGSGDVVDIPLKNGVTSGAVSVEDLAKATGMSVEDVVAVRRKMTQAQHVLSLDYEYARQSRSGSDTSSAMATDGSLFQNDRAFREDADLAEKTQLRADVIAAMARNLDAREARLVRLRYGLSSDGRTRTLAECAEAMGISRTRAQQLATRCLKKLREAAEAESLQEYLLTVA